MNFLPFEELIVASPADWDLAALADRHYSRRTVGARQFLDVGKKLPITNATKTFIFGWVWQQDGKRWDGQTGFYCAIFRNESEQRSSDIILECERIAFEHWGRNRMFTYVDPAELRPLPHKYRKPRVPGHCFIKAGWRFERVAASGKHLLVKENAMATVTPAKHISTEQEKKLEELFTYHAPESDEQLRAYQAVRQWGLSLAKIICQYTPKGSDQSAAIRKVREACMMANAAIALKGLNF